MSIVQRVAKRFTSRAAARHPEAQIVNHPDLKNLAKFWDAKLKEAEKLFEKERQPWLADETQELPTQAAQYLVEVGETQHHDLGYLRSVVHEMEQVEKKYLQAIRSARTMAELPYTRVHSSHSQHLPETRLTAPSR